MKEQAPEDADRSALKLERLELALRASNEGIWDWWTDRDEIFYSRRILEFLECGDRRAPHLFKPPFESIHPDERWRFEMAVTQALTDGGPETFAADARVLSGAGTWRWLRIRGTVVRDRSGRCQRIAGSMIDISHRKRAEAELEDERFLLRELIEHIPPHVYFKDHASRFVMANRGMARWLGLEHSADLIGKHDRDFFDEEHWKAAEADEIRIMETGEPITDQLEQETWHQRHATWVLTSKFPWRDRHGHLKGTFGVSSNVTALINAQQELMEKNRAYEEELMLAREIQQALTGRGFRPILGPAGRLDFGSRYIPISGLAGDFFEVIQIDRDRAGILICDVMGHGVRSALIVAVLRGLLETQRAEAGDPGGFLAGLNDGLTAILRRADATMFATAFYGVIDLADRTFRHASAAHPGPILDGPDGVRQINSQRCDKGPALGLFPDSRFPSHEIPLAEIRRLILFTDGILEAENREGEPFFEQRLMDIVARKTGQPLEAALDGILSSVLAFSETLQFDDDVCLLGADISTADSSVPSLFATGQDYH